MSLAPPKRLPELEGLRGILSWWVVISHAVQMAGYTEAILGPGMRLLVHGDYAVSVFIILSGFVIHKRWQDCPDSYAAFITQRFLRLWPAFMVCLAGALLLRPCIEAGLACPQLGDPHLFELTKQDWQNEQSHLGGHLLAHIFMVHGAIPDQWLPSSAVAILAPAWSISLEWQFYLIAIPLFWALKRGGAVAWTVFAIVAGQGWMNRYSPPLGDWFPMRSALPQQLLLFGIGMISYRLWEACHDRGKQIAAPLFGFAVLAPYFTLWLPFAIWVAAAACCLSDGGRAKALLNSAPLQALGRVSYSTYLGHMLVFWPLYTLGLRTIPGVSSPAMLAVLLGLGAPLILFLSKLLYRWVESPAIAFGRRLNFR